MGNNYSLKIYGMYALRTLKCNIYIGLTLKPFASQISRNIGVFFATWRLYLELEPTGRNTTGRNSPQTLKKCFPPEDTALLKVTRFGLGVSANLLLTPPHAFLHCIISFT